MLIIECHYCGKEMELIEHGKGLMGAWCDKIVFNNLHHPIIIKTAKTFPL